MKTYKSILIAAFLIAFSVQTFGQLRFTNDRRLGINMPPAFTLDINGTTRFYGWTSVVLDWSGPWGNPVLFPVDKWSLDLGKQNQAVNTLWTYMVKYSNGLYKYSDERLKKDITPIENPLELIKRTNAVSYYHNYSINDKAPNNIKESQNIKQYGYIAQDFKNTFPNLVSQNNDSLGYYSIDYVGLVPIITEALKEQQNQISTLQNIVYSQEKEIIELKKAIEKLLNKDNKLKSTLNSSNNSVIQLDEQSNAILMQNIPNPFTVDTEIKFFLTDVISSARLIIHDMQGLEILNYTINESGNGSKIIKGSELKAGMYLYTLIADGKIIDSKRMILTSE